MKSIATIGVLLLLSGCAHWFSPADGFFYAVGSTPGNTPCQLSVATVDSNGNPREWTVSGNFRESITVNQSRKGHRIALSCDNTVVASRTFKYGRDVSIGGELLVNGSAPLTIHSSRTRFAGRLNSRVRQQT